MLNNTSYNQHRILYTQFVNDSVIRLVVNNFTKREIEILQDEYKNGNHHLNMIPAIPLSKWDILHPFILQYVNNKFEDTGVWKTLSTSVCIAKEAMKIYIESI